MDVDATLRGLYREKTRVERAIARLEKQLAAFSEMKKTRRGRKTMSAEERLEVSRRMTAYWAARRSHKLNDDSV